MSTLWRPLEVRDAAPRRGAGGGDLPPIWSPRRRRVRGELPRSKHVLAVGGALAGHARLHALTATPVAAGRPQRRRAVTFCSTVVRGAAWRAESCTHDAPLAASHAATRARVIGADRRATACSRRHGSSRGLRARPGPLVPAPRRRATCLLPARTAAARGVRRPAAAPPCSRHTVLYGQMMHDLRRSPRRARHYSTSVRHAVSGAEALPATLAPALRRHVRHHAASTASAPPRRCTSSSRIGPATAPRGPTGRPARRRTRRASSTTGGEPLPATRRSACSRCAARSVARGYWRHDAESAPSSSRAAGSAPAIASSSTTTAGTIHCGRADDHFKVGGRWVCPARWSDAARPPGGVGVRGGRGARRGRAGAAGRLRGLQRGARRRRTELGRELMEFVKSEICALQVPASSSLRRGAAQGRGGQGAAVASARPAARVGALRRGGARSRSRRSSVASSPRRCGRWARARPVLSTGGPLTWRRRRRRCSAERGALEREVLRLDATPPEGIERVHPSWWHARPRRREPPPPLPRARRHRPPGADGAAAPGAGRRRWRSLDALGADGADDAGDGARPPSRASAFSAAPRGALAQLCARLGEPAASELVAEVKLVQPSPDEVRIAQAALFKLAVDAPDARALFVSAGASLAGPVAGGARRGPVAARRPAPAARLRQQPRRRSRRRRNQRRPPVLRRGRRPAGARYIWDTEA